jgi:hypothetical protein
MTVVESADGVELLLEVGLDRRVIGSAEVEISADDGEWSRRQVLLLRHSPSPQELARAVTSIKPHHDGLFFVVPHAGRALTEAAERDHRIAYAAINDGVVGFLGEVRRVAADETSMPHAGRTSWTRLAMMRLFALMPVQPLTQLMIARILGVSHVAVGKQLPLPGGLVRRGPEGWQAVDRAACWDRFMADYPGPRGLTTYWAATAELSEHLNRVERVMHQRGHEAPAVSGDFAADYYAPWRRPARAVAYVTVQPPLEEYGFATVRSADATIELRTPRDPTILAMTSAHPLPGGGVPRRYVDPLVAAWDLRRSPGGDVESAVDELRARTLRERRWP